MVPEATGGVRMSALDDVTLCCPICREQYVALGITDEARDRAAAAGPQCCPPSPPSEVGGGEAPTSLGATFTLGRLRHRRQRGPAPAPHGDEAHGAGRPRVPALAPMTGPDWVLLVSVFVLVFSTMAVWCWAVVAGAVR